MLKAGVHRAQGRHADGHLDSGGHEAMTNEDQDLL